ncbi:MAG: ABC transporter ATP-binding protein [Desulfococcaceae bacterium]|jgi:ATP-binding cassette subfamily B protein|nr:ABC transporter ATP-binding protein [Desulfococcaceae bacterium]
MFSDYGYSEEKKLGKAYDFRLLKRLWPFTRPYRIHLFCAVLLIICITLLELALPYVTKMAIDRHIVPDREISGRIVGNEKNRLLYADTSRQEIADLVRKYPSLFHTDSRGSGIALADVSKMEMTDIMVLRQKDIAGVGFLAGIFLIIVLLDFGLNFVQVMVMEYAGQGVMHDLRMKLFSHIQGLSVSFFNRSPVARLVTRTTNDVQNMHELFTSVIVFVFKDVFLLTGIAAVLLSIRWQLALICFTLLPFMIWISLYFSRQVREIFRTLRIKTSEINTRFSETIGGIKVIQLFRQEKANYKKFTVLNHEFYEAGMGQIRIFGIFMPMIELFNAVALALVIYYGGRGVLSEEVSLGVLVAFISYMRMFFNPIRDIAEKYNILQNAMSSAERIFLLLDTDERLPSPEKEPRLLQNIEHIAFENVCHAYVKGETVLQDVSFRITAGETVAIVGPTGAGKTSVINLLIRFYDPVSGCIRINGQDIRELDIARVRSETALVTQDPFLFSGAVRDNIVQGNRDFSEEKMMEVLENANCLSLIEKLPDGLDTLLSEGGSSISSGERQLLSIARAFARDPGLILLDEATSYIDSETEVRIQEALARLTENRTAIIVAHRLSTARSADKILVLRQGSIIESGNHAQLMEKRGFYYKLHQLQNRSSEDGAAPGISVS